MFKKLEDIKARYEFLSAQLADSEVIADMPTWQKYSKEQADLTETVEKYGEYLEMDRRMKDAFAEAEQESDAEMKKMLLDEGYECKEALPKIVGELKILLLPKDKNDERSCILEVRAGTGGEEAALFAAELCRMYLNYCANHRLRVEEMDVNATELGGMKEAIYNVTGAGAYKLLKYESGVHRVQRVPATETQGRIHTSAATVAVLPEAEEVEVEINDKDIRIDIFIRGARAVKTSTRSPPPCVLPTSLRASSSPVRTSVPSSKTRREPSRSFAPACTISTTGRARRRERTAAAVW